MLKDNIPLNRAKLTAIIGLYLTVSIAIPNTQAQEELTQKHKAGMDKIQFLVGDWSGTMQQFRDGKWSTSTPVETKFVRAMQDKYIDGGALGYQWQVSYDWLQKKYRMTSRDNFSGLIDVYEGIIDEKGRLKVTNIGPGTYYMQGTKKIHNRLVLAPTTKGFEYLVDATEDQGKTWFHQVKAEFDTKK